MKFAETVKEETQEKRNVYVSVPENSSITIVPLVNYASKEDNDAITRFKEFGIGTKKTGFFSLPDTQESNDICRVIGLQSKDKYIMPVLLYDDANETWSEPMYYKFPVTVFKELGKVLENIKTYCESEKENGNNVDGIGFKGALIKITRDDKTPNGFTAYSANWLFKHWSRIKKNGALPESDLDIIKGIVPFTYEDDNDYREQVLVKLINNADKSVTLGKGDTEVKTTIGKLLQEHGFMKKPESVETEFEMSEDE